MSDPNQTDQENVRKVLRDLRRRVNNMAVNNDIAMLENILGDPVFCQYSQKGKSSVTNRSSRHKKDTEFSVGKESTRLTSIRSQLEPLILPLLNEKQKLIFVELNMSDIPITVVETNDLLMSLLIVAPNDLRSRSGGRIRVGDRILAINNDLLSSLAERPLNPESKLERPTNGAVPSQSSSVSTVISPTVERQKSGKASRSDRSFTSLTSDPVAPQIPYISKNDDSEKSTSRQLITTDSEASTAPTEPSLPKLNRISEFNRRLNDAKELNESVVLTVVRESTPMVLTGDWTQVQIIQLNNESNVGLGFGIVGGTSTGVVVKTILPGGVADKDGRLRPGDHILRIGAVCVHGMGSQQVATILRQQQSVVELVVGRPLNTSLSEKPEDTPSRPKWKCSTYIEPVDTSWIVNAAQSPHPIISSRI